MPISLLGFDVIWPAVFIWNYKMNIHHYVSSGNFDEFSKALMSCDDLLARDHEGKTVFHLIASKKEEALLKTFFLKKSRSNHDYLAEYEARLRAENISMEDALSIQDDNGDSPIHKAIAADNWHLAQYFSNSMGYNGFSPKYFRNSYGLTEYEYALVLYGLNSRAEEMRNLFKHERYKGGISRQSLLEIKTATKAFKYIEVKNSDFVGIVTSDDPLFMKARDNDYPSSLSSFYEDCDLAKFCKKHGLPAYNYTVEHAWPLVSVDELLARSNISNDRKVRFYSFLCEFYSFICYQDSDNPNQRNKHITVTCDATNQVGITEYEARGLEFRISEFMRTRSPSRQEAYWPYVEWVYTRKGLNVIDS